MYERMYARKPMHVYRPCSLHDPMRLAIVKGWISTILTKPQYNKVPSGTVVTTLQFVTNHLFSIKQTLS